MNKALLPWSKEVHMFKISLHLHNIRKTPFSPGIVIQKRVLDYLKDQGRKLGKTSFNLPLQKKNLANFLGLTPETLSRQLNALQSAGQIIVKGQFITLN